MSTSTTTASKPKKGLNIQIPTVTKPAVDARVRDKLITARVGLLLRHAFFGNMASRLELVNADEWLATAATDGRRFYYNSEFVDMLTAKQTEFLFGHEVLHNVYDHMGRRGTRDPRLWNIADDFCVNADLLDQRIGDKITQVDILYDPKYRGMSAEEVYDKLYENAEKIDITQLLEGLLDEHLDDEDGDGDGEGEKEGKGGRPKLTAEEKKQIRDELKEAVLNAANAVGAGSLPAGIRRMIQDLTVSRMNWRELLRQQIESTVKSDYSWMRASRKGWHMDAIMPGMKPGEQIDVCIALDMSGSIGPKEIKEMISEVKGIMESYEEYKIHLWTFDTSVYNPQVFTSDNLDDILNYQPQGGGGTSFECNWDFMKEEGIEPKKFIMFTDGFPGDGWGDELYCDTVFIIHGSTTIEPPFGVHAYYDAKAK
jgi:predicted metal-dependent peptidase